MKRILIILSIFLLFIIMGCEDENRIEDDIIFNEHNSEQVIEDNKNTEYLESEEQAINKIDYEQRIKELEELIFNVIDKGEQEQHIKELEELIEQVKDKIEYNQHIKDLKELVEQLKATIPLHGFKILIDAGHGINSFNGWEDESPNYEKKKEMFHYGTSGKTMAEHELNLIIAKALQEKLEAKGATVFMTREGRETDLSNKARALLGGELEVDLAFKIHADGHNNPAVSGPSMLIPSKQSLPELYEESKIAGKIIMDSYIESTGMKSRGLIERSDLTNFNWSEVPVILIEMGFMTNPDEDALMMDTNHQVKMVDGMLEGIIKYYEDIKSRNNAE